MLGQLESYGDVSLFLLGAALLLTILFVFIATRRAPAETTPPPQPPQPPQPPEPPEPPIDPKRINDVMTKLKSANATLYGAAWCGYTRKQWHVLGQDESSIPSCGVNYVACDAPENEDVCKTAGVNAFPTWSIGGQLYPGFMDIDGLEDAVR